MRPHARNITFTVSDIPFTVIPFLPLTVGQAEALSEYKSFARAHFLARVKKIPAHNLARARNGASGCS